MSRIVKVALCLPWYDGPDRDCSSHFLVFQHYLGRLQERLWWLAHKSGPLSQLPPLDPVNKSGTSEVPASLIGTQFEFGIADEVGCSLPGMARERSVEAALKWGADYCLFYDDDMVFGTDAFLRLYQDQQPVVGALAFTSRLPITPVIYTFNSSYRREAGRIAVDIEPIWDYKPDTLYRVDAIGSGMMLIEAQVFRRIPKPWFNSPGLGEDIFFCIMCREHGIPVHVDTRVQTIHKPTFHQQWHDEEMYRQQRTEKVP